MVTGSKGVTIMIVDDDSTTIDVLSAFLEDVGTPISSAPMTPRWPSP
jgi:CheY-like chemotaxis protein